MNMRLKENGSLFTAVAMFYSISMTWNLWFLLTLVKTSKISLLESASGTFNFSYGRCYFMEKAPIFFTGYCLKFLSVIELVGRSPTAEIY